MNKSAKFSDCGKYRYVLSRVWDYSQPIAMCIGLNPSTANHETDDPTIRQLISRLKYLGYGGFHMCNLFGLISSKPERLFSVPDNQGDNMQWLEKISGQVNEIIFCWGDFKGIDYRAKRVTELFPKAVCFGKNKSGTPIHPLAMMYNGLSIEQTKIQIYKSEPITKTI